MKRAIDILYGTYIVSIQMRQSGKCQRLQSGFDF